MQKNVLVSIGLVVVILVAGLGVWAFQRGILYFENGLPKISIEKIKNPVPGLGRSITYPEGFPEESKPGYEKRRAELEALVKADPLNAVAWYDLAIHYRVTGDYDGAVEIWEYLVGINPGEGIALHNLAQHYFYNAKEYEKAERYYERSIEGFPGLLSNYTELYEMYRYAYKQDTDAAIKILERGIETISGTSQIDLQAMLGRHYRDVVGDKENARTYLTEARDAAQEAGNRDLASILTAEINAL